MHVLYCSAGFSPHDYRFLDALNRSKHQISFWAFSDIDPLESRKLPERIQDLRKTFPLRANKYRCSLQVARTIANIIQQIKPDLVHAGPLQEIAFPLSLTHFHPLVAMSWGSDILLGARSGVGWWKAKYVLRRCDGFVCDSQVVLNRAEVLGVHRTNSVVFPWGVDLDQFSPGKRGGLRTDLGWDRATVLLSTRNWEPIYGVDLLLEAFAQVATEMPELRMIMLGGGSMRVDIEQAVHRFGLVDKIHIAGRVAYADLPAYYQSADIYASASYSDGSSVSLLEAMATGLVCVVSDIPGNREWVSHGREGFLFESGNLESLTRTLRECIEAKGEWLQLGCEARALVEARADWKKNSAKLFDAYRAALQKARAS